MTGPHSGVGGSPLLSSPNAGHSLRAQFPNPTGELQSPRTILFFGMLKKKKKGKGKNKREFHGNISLGFCKILSHPHMEPKTQARTESAGIAPLTYCSDMQIPSLPLKTESTSTFKANFGFIVHVAPRSTAAQHSWLAHTPADAVPGSLAAPPRVLGAAAGKTLHFRRQRSREGDTDPETGGQKPREGQRSREGEVRDPERGDSGFRAQMKPGSPLGHPSALFHTVPSPTSCPATLETSVPSPSRPLRPFTRQAH